MKLTIYWNFVYKVPLKKPSFWDLRSCLVRISLERLSFNKCTGSLTILRKKPRNNRPELYCNKSALINFTQFTGKHLCQSLIFNKFSELSPATLLKKTLWYGCFPVNFAKFSKTPFLQNTSDCIWKPSQQFSIY